MTRNDLTQLSSTLPCGHEVYRVESRQPQASLTNARRSRQSGGRIRVEAEQFGNDAALRWSALVPSPVMSSPFVTRSFLILLHWTYYLMQGYHYRHSHLSFRCHSTVFHACRILLVPSMHPDPLSSGAHLLSPSRARIPSLFRLSRAADLSSYTHRFYEPHILAARSSRWFGHFSGLTTPLRCHHCTYPFQLPLPSKSSTYLIRV